MQLRGATVVVTGGTGFLGRHVCAELESVGANVIALGRQDYDLLHRAEAGRLVAELQPNAVVHLAAVVGGIGANEREPGRFLFENAIMGLELIDACRIGGVDKVLVAGTVCSYPKFAQVPFREDELWDGYPEETNAPYGIAKKVLLVQAQAYRDQYGMDVNCLLPVNLYGPGDNFDLVSGHVIPAMIRKFVEAREAGAPTVTLWGDGSASREFLFVSDAARAFRLALVHDSTSDPINVGSGAEITIAELAKIVMDATRFRGTILWDSTRPNGQPRRKLDTERARQRLGFEATVSLPDGIAATVAYYEDMVDQNKERTDDERPFTETKSRSMTERNTGS